MELILTRADSVAARVEALIHASATSIDAALYRFNLPRLAAALAEAARRGVRVRVVLDRNKYEESRTTRELFPRGPIPFRLSFGRNGPGSKMHHKFALFDGRTAVTGSYNWTVESEEQNFENLLITSDPESLRIIQVEFESLWAASTLPE